MVEMRGGGSNLDDRNEAVQWQRQITKPEAYFVRYCDYASIQISPPGMPATLRPCRMDLPVGIWELQKLHQIGILENFLGLRVQNSHRW